MQRTFMASVLIVLCCAACATVKEAPEDARLLDAQLAFDEGQRLTKAGQYAEAMPHVERALKQREAVLGKMHPEVASCLDLLGMAHAQRGSYADAEPPLQRALEIREASFGKKHPDVATSLYSLANLYRRQGLYARAEPLYERSLSIREASLGKNHPDVATSLSGLANLYFAQALLERVGPLLERALAIREAALDKNHPNIATSLRGLASLYMAQGDDERAKSLFERALTIQEAALGKNHPNVASSLDLLGNLYTSQGHYELAEPLFERALAIRESALGKNHPDVAGSLSSLATLYRLKGLYARSTPLYQRALTIRESTLGKSHPEVADSLNNLAIVYWRQGFYAQAESLFERAIAILESAHHPSLAHPLHNLASLYVKQGLYARAEPLLQRAIEIIEAAFGKRHVKVTNVLNDLAILYQKQGYYEWAEPLLQRALVIREAALGKNHPDVARSLDYLASLYEQQGHYTQAEPLLQRALVIQESALGKNHPDVAHSLHNLASLYEERGDYARAESLFQRALTIQESTLGKNHPDIAQSLNRLARLSLAQQRLAETLSFFERAFSVSEGYLRQEVFGFSEARLASVLNLLRGDEERRYALVRAHLDDARVRRLALTAALLRKGRSVEELADTSRIIYHDLGQADREAFARLRDLRTEFATLSLAGPGKLSPAEYQQRLKALADQSDTLEADLARRSAPLRALHALPSPAEFIDKVAAALPSDGALIEFVAYRDTLLVPSPAPPASRNSSELRYLALLLFADGRTQALDLGPAAPIDAAVMRLHDALARRTSSYQPTSRELYNLVFRPLVPHLGKTQRLFLAPDGQLALAPFAALHDGKRFLVDAWDVTYLTSGKELLRRLENSPPAHSVVVLAAPELKSLPAHTPSPVAPAAPAEHSAALERFFSTLRAELADQQWAPLPGTKKEAEAIQRLLPQARLLLGAAATKQALLGLETPGVLHIATHAFFLEDAPTPAATRAVVNASLLDAGPARRPADPLLRSGLVLANALAQGTQPGERRLEDSLVTALELAGMDLWGTQLVVLSACETGRGDVKLGQGVYGLRRALVVAGAETVVTSLWKVNDETTHELMEGYYRKLLAGEGRTSALRDAMRELRQKKPHPYYWAPFITIGQDAPLQGVVPH
jgi:CHAT domain-containing protein/Tfp pilus assembly protein PilF